MAVLEIIQPDNPILRKKAIKVQPSSFKSEKFQSLIDDMIETMGAANGVGLAGPQVAQSLRVIVIRLPDTTEEDREEYGDNAGKVFVVANPKIIKSSRDMVMGVEGCLSLPGLLGEVERPDMVVVTGQDRHGKDFRIKAKGWLARVFQHEIDHLEGTLFIDLTEDVWHISDTPEEEQAAAEASAPAETTETTTEEA